MSSRSNRVLAAEDEPLILAELQDMLADLGYEVVASELTLEGAMAKSRELAFDVAVLDISLRTSASIPLPRFFGPVESLS